MHKQLAISNGQWLKQENSISVKQEQLAEAAFDRNLVSQPVRKQLEFVQTRATSSGKCQGLGKKLPQGLPGANC